MPCSLAFVIIATAKRCIGSWFEPGVVFRAASVSAQRELTTRTSVLLILVNQRPAARIRTGSRRCHRDARDDAGTGRFAGRRVDVPSGTEGSLQQRAALDAGPR
jgi:hypothetical protein